MGKRLVSFLNLSIESSHPASPRERNSAAPTVNREHGILRVSRKTVTQLALFVVPFADLTNNLTYFYNDTV